jgi:uncharacterized protein (DUF1501 family)
MDRRSFIKMAGATGLAIASPVVPRSAVAQELYDGPLYLFVGASGGWDPTSFCDPKGYQTEDEDNPMNRLYANAAIEKEGEISYAPVGYFPEFVKAHYQKMLVINGVDTQTNGHDSGRRHIASGRLQESFPSFGALVAAVHGQGLPMGFITNGFYDATGGTTVRTRVQSVDSFARIARPNHVNANDVEGRLFHTEETMRRIRETQNSRLEAMRSSQRLPHLRDSMGTLHMARMGDNILERLLEHLPDDNGGERLFQQTRLAIAAYKAGSCVSANLAIGGFDTHGDHDNRHIDRLSELFRGVNFIWEEAERQGVADRVIVIVGSDFGRTPGYNDGRGKDHWSVTSMILMGKGVQGNRTIGATTERHGLKSIDPTTMSVVDGMSGVRIRPGHIHTQLRKLSGIDKTDFHQMFPLDVKEDVSLLGL